MDVVTIANNHARDYGNRGLADTIANLSPYVAVSGYERMPILTVKGVDVGFVSNLGWSFDAAQKQFITNAVRDLLRPGGADVIVFNYHWGEERQYQSNATQRAIAHYCIDQGADPGHRPPPPHVVQEVETYKGKTIVYSLGNLSFGGNRNPTDKNCLIFQQTFVRDLNTGAGARRGEPSRCPTRSLPSITATITAPRRSEARDKQREKRDPSHGSIQRPSGGTRRSAWKRSGAAYDLLDSLGIAYRRADPRAGGHHLSQCAAVDAALDVVICKKSVFCATGRKRRFIF